MGKKFRDFDPYVLEAFDFDFSSKHARINHGTVLLSWFVEPPKGSRKVLELGAGSGVISIYLAKTFGLEVTGVEVDRELHTVATKNASLNGVENLTRFVNCDIDDYAANNRGEVFDMVVSNPPHFLHSGVESPDGKRNRARRIDPELAMVFASATSKLLKNRGAFFFLLHPRDLTKWVRLLEDLKLGIHKMRFAHGSMEGQAQLVLVSGRKSSSSEIVVEPPIRMR
ncbi:tRNA1(Val) (adenine(37)-N6)-methyltransferase [Mesotoga sp. H07.pep.5.3]|uniref:tRNA1(Val) (adenine(37)-N6)-methyltransferase n=1 Tax=Mesotoga sp. H07.pep.5.3 TaxID=1421003 RepID=UPI000C1922A9|nr:methyltransferase [Mesotoga sp. H07.pep.5.3]PIJ60695.1 methyltransferase type 11 [Mesotoga sp. H07.pep.5.3]